MHGIFVINKPKGPTSHDMIYKVRKATGEKRVGHAGTLDPLASGVLVVAVGREYTKQLEAIVQKEKEYLATIQLGMTSTTDDEEGEKSKVLIRQWADKFQVPNQGQVEKVFQQFVGKIEQVPPVFSAIKVKGTPAHRRIRRGQKVELQPRPALIHSIELLEYSYPLLHIKVVTGKGVYIRALARDIGKELETGAYLKELVRTRVGQYTVEQAVTIDSLTIKNPASI